MSIFKFWDRASTLYPPAGGEVFTPSVMAEKYPWIQNPNAIVVISEVGGVLQSVDNLEILKSNYGVDNDNPEEAITEIEAKITEIQAQADNASDPNDAIVARLDYMIMMSEVTM